jgi:hypothetical protein
MENAYKVFKRSARNFEEFARAQKQTVERGLTYEQAQRMCRQFNESRTAAQINRGTKYEFESE